MSVPGYEKQGWLLIALLLLTGGCGEPPGGEQPEPGWYRGNLHTHSYWSDGDNYPEMIMRWYKSRGYDFVALSDHNTLAEGERWMAIEPGSSRDSVFREYREAFGGDWVEHEERDTLIRVRLKTLEEYRRLFEEPGEFLVLRSEEITDSYGGKPIHVNATNIQEMIAPQGGNSVAEVMQNNIDAVLEQRERTGEPIIPHLNHPNFGWAVTAEDLKKLEGERFFEVYNGHPAVHNYGDSLRSGTEQMWDEVNTFNLLQGKSLLYGLAVDDAHHYHEQSVNHANTGRGWIMVRADSLSPGSLIGAMERGDFYATTGVRLAEVTADSNSITLSIEAEEEVDYHTQFIGTLRGEPARTGVVLEEASGTEVSYAFTGNELFVRAKVVSDKPQENPYREGDTEVAWTQPVVPPATSDSPRR